MAEAFIIIIILVISFEFFIFVRLTLNNNWIYLKILDALEIYTFRYFLNIFT